MSSSEPTSSPSTHFECSVPILRVTNLQASLDFYLQVLGFKVDWQAPGFITGISRGKAGLMLCEGDQGQPGCWVWIGVGDVGKLFREYSAQGAPIKLPPTNYPWALEMQVQDPDGHILRFGSEPNEGPFADWVMWYRE